MDVKTLSEQQQIALRQLGALNGRFKTEYHELKWILQAFKGDKRTKQVLTASVARCLIELGKRGLVTHHFRLWKLTDTGREIAQGLGEKVNE